MNTRCPPLLFIVVLIALIFTPCWAFEYANPQCDCYSLKNEYYKNIHHSYQNFQNTLRKSDLCCLGYQDFQWQSNYFERQKSMLQNYIYHPILFNEYYRNMVIDIQRLQLVKEFNLEFWLRFYKNDTSDDAYQKQVQNILKSEMICQNAYNQSQFEIFENFSNLLRQCTAKHANPQTIYDYGLLECLKGNYGESISLIQRTIELANQSGETGLLISETFKNLGIACIEAMAFEEAIKALTEAINRDPESKEAYFHRAVAYFENGQFDLAISDYLQSDTRQLINTPSYASAEFTFALLASLYAGSSEAMQDFFPSLLSSIYGIGSTLWVFAEHPVDGVINFSNICYEMGIATLEFCNSLDQNAIEGMADEIKQLYKNFNQLSDSEKGRLIGYTIGKYGLDIFAPGSTLKCMATAKRLRDANRVCNLEALTLSQANKEKIINTSLSYKKQRELYIQNLSIQWDHQNKHIPTAHNYIPGRSIIDIDKKRLEVLITQNAGKGQKLRGDFGFPGFKECVEFNEYIGLYITPPNINLPTTKGILHYSKKGVHLVPSDPQAILKP